MIRSIRVLAIAAALATFGVTGGVHGKPSNATARAHEHRHHHRHRHHHHHKRHHRRRLRRRSDTYGVTPQMMRMAERVSMCEEGGDWDFVGTVFDGGIGWTLGNWQAFRKPTWPRWMHEASPHMQANALFRFVRHYGIAMPDQAGGCAGY